MNRKIQYANASEQQIVIITCWLTLGEPTKDVRILATSSPSSNKLHDGFRAKKKLIFFPFRDLDTCAASHIEKGGVVSGLCVQVEWSAEEPNQNMWGKAEKSDQMSEGSKCEEGRDLSHGRAGF